MRRAEAGRCRTGGSCAMPFFPVLCESADKHEVQGKQCFRRGKRPGRQQRCRSGGKRCGMRKSRRSAWRQGAPCEQDKIGGAKRTQENRREKCLFWKFVYECNGAREQRRLPDERPEARECGGPQRGGRNAAPGDGDKGQKAGNAERACNKNDVFRRQKMAYAEERGEQWPKCRPKAERHAVQSRIQGNCRRPYVRDEDRGREFRQAVMEKGGPCRGHHRGEGQKKDAASPYAPQKCACRHIYGAQAEAGLLRGDGEEQNAQDGEKNR